MISLLYYQIATYIENDVQNALIDIQNKGAIAIISNHYGVLRTILRDRLNGARSYRYIYKDE